MIAIDPFVPLPFKGQFASFPHLQPPLQPEAGGVRCRADDNPEDAAAVDLEVEVRPDARGRAAAPTPARLLFLLKSDYGKLYSIL